ncbi:beta-ketoacyl-[acyl-carrier-protein] synthase family protein [bacterium]|nr:beta-ketoacyl-[acyl-carrier-protein] synthase family protein [bacterium]
MPERIFITGLGAVCPLGSTIEAIWERLERGTPPFQPLTMVDTSQYKSHLGAEVREIDSADLVPANQARRMDRVSLMAAIASIRAVRDAGLSDRLAENNRAGIVMGTGVGSTNYTDDFFVGLVQKGPASANPMLFPNTVPNAAASSVSIILKMRGLNTTFSHKEISAEQAVIYAIRQLRLGHADVVLVGGAEEISPFLFHAFAVTQSLAPRNPNLPEMMSPYDQKRNGLVLGEGAAVMVLETESHVRSRQGRPYAELVGAEMASENVGSLGYHPEGHDLLRAIRTLLYKNPTLMNRLDLISGGANSTTLLDRAEAHVLSTLNQEIHQHVPVLALKAYTGCFHGAGVLRLVMSILIMNNNFLPRIPNLTEPIPDYQLDFLMTERPQQEINTVLHCASSYGGTSCAILLNKVSQS